LEWLFRSKATPIWALLFFATCISWALGTYRLAGSGVSLELASIAVMLIAMIKIRFVLIHFMELKHAPWIWRALFETWVTFVGIALVTTYLII
jgi:heme/copper-type cytochrome/quinol oxidase subunit 4